MQVDHRFHEDLTRSASTPSSSGCVAGPSAPAPAPAAASGRRSGAAPADGRDLAGGDCRGPAGRAGIAGPETVPSLSSTPDAWTATTRTRTRGAAAAHRDGDRASRRGRSVGSRRHGGTGWSHPGLRDRGLSETLAYERLGGYRGSARCSGVHAGARSSRRSRPWACAGEAGLVSDRMKWGLAQRHLPPASAATPTSPIGRLLADRALIDENSSSAHRGGGHAVRTAGQRRLHLHPGGYTTTSACCSSAASRKRALAGHIGSEHLRQWLSRMDVHAAARALTSVAQRDGPHRPSKACAARPR